MNKREIITLMHKLFRGDIYSPDGYIHLFKNDCLDEKLLSNFLSKYNINDTILIYLDSNNVVECKANNSYKIIKEFVKSGRVRIADPDFKNRALIEPTGVGIGSSNK